jgi:pimeloyl-ACP methyl ester carboxylesterase
MEATMMTNGFIISNGLKLYYEIEGEGHAVVLLSGGPGFSHEYLQPLRALASDAQLIFFDQIRQTCRIIQSKPTLRM